MRPWADGSAPVVPPDVLGDIIAAASDIALVISSDGEVLSVLASPGPGGLGHWQGRNIRDVLTIESVPKLEARLLALASGETSGRPMELNHRDGGAGQLPVRYTVHPIGPDGTVLMLGRDMRAVAEAQERLVKAQAALEQDYEARRGQATLFRALLDTTGDAVLFVALGTGRVTEINGPAAALLGGPADGFPGTEAGELFGLRGGGEVLAALEDAAAATPRKTVKVVALSSQKRLTVSPRVFRAGGEQVLLCLIRGPGAAEPGG